MFSNVISITAAALASSMIQAMNSTKHYAKMMLIPQKPQIIGNDQYVTPPTSNMKTGGMWFTFPQLAGGVTVTFLNPSLDLSIAVESESPPHVRTIAKQKTGWHKESGRMEATATGTTTHKGGNTFQKWGGRQTYRMLSRQRREIQSIAHSQPTKSGKEWVDYASKIVWVLMMMITPWLHFTHL